MKDASPEFRRQARRLAVTWLALLALMLASLGLAFVPLGAGNLVAGLAIAALKAGLVATFFMGLLRERPLVRLVAAVAICCWLLLAGLSGVDFATRPTEPAAVQGKATP